MQIETVTTEVKSDISGQVATQVRSLTLPDGTRYEGDVTDREAEAFDKRAAALFDYYSEKFRPVATMASASRNDLSEVRAWAKDNGFAVGERGRLSAEIHAAWATRNDEPVAAEAPAETA